MREKYGIIIWKEDDEPDEEEEEDDDATVESFESAEWMVQEAELMEAGFSGSKPVMVRGKKQIWYYQNGKRVAAPKVAAPVKAKAAKLGAKKTPVAAKKVVTKAKPSPKAARAQSKMDALRAQKTTAKQAKAVEKVKGKSSKDAAPKKAAPAAKKAGFTGKRKEGSRTVCRVDGKIVPCSTMPDAGKERDKKEVEKSKDKVTGGENAKPKSGTAKPTDRPGGPAASGASAKPGKSVAGETERPGDKTDGQGRSDGDRSASASVAPRVPATIEEANRRLDRFGSLFRAKGQHEAADWMDKLKAHVNAVGTDEALKSLGAEMGKGDSTPTLYQGEADAMGDFCKSYLGRHGITPLASVGVPLPSERVVSSVSPQFGASSGDPYMVGDFMPNDPTFKDKLEESKHLPGLESSEDISKIMGAPVTHLTPDVTAKMDERYGQGQWIIKTYGDEGFAGFGIFFPQRIAQISQDARNTIWNAGENIGQHGFEFHRDKAGKVDGIQHKNGDVYQFGTEKYNDHIYGDVRHHADRAAAVAENEKGPALLDRNGKAIKEFMAQPAFKSVGISDAERARGVTGAEGGKGEGRVHIVTRNGKAEAVPHSTWIKGESLPVVFEDDNTRAMAQAAVDAINNLPASERNGQIYAPDIMPSADGYRVVEANPANKTGSSGYLGDNPFIIDSYVSHLTDREPAHVRFIRNILSKKGKR